MAAVAGGAIASGGRGHDKSDDVRRAIDDGRARNVIYFLGDGMGDSEITVARNYELGAAGRFKGIDAPLFTGEATTWAVEESNPSLPNYVTDSAASGTAWATGVKTSNGRISTTAGTDKDLRTILERADRLGYRTGNVTTAELTDATPAVLDSHVNDRGCQGPANMANCASDKKSAGGAGSIAEQTVDHHVDVLLGGGKARFDQTIDGGPDTGKTVIQSAQRQGYEVVTDRTGLLAARSGKRLLGLFNPSNMVTEWNGPIAQPYPAGAAAVKCDESFRTTTAPNQPTLAEMTTKAIQLLDGGRHDRNGFYLQVEGASIDKQDHAENACAQIGETVEFDKAIQVGLAYARTHPDTLIVVTADHAHTSQIIEAGQTATHHSPGAITTLTTKEGATLVVNYATNIHGQSQDHTGSEVRVAAQGPQAANVLGVVDQTDLNHLLASAIGAE